MRTCTVGGKISNFFITSPIGDIEISCCAKGLHLVTHCAKDDSNFSPDQKIPVSVKSDTDHNITECDAAHQSYIWLKNFFTQKIASPNIPPLCSSVVKADTFCAKALQLLPKEAPFGTTITYKDLARSCGNVKACRAAGQAMSTNPVFIIIPCHRVINSDGGLGNYGHGKKNKIKQWLLEFEKNIH
ncbi:unnamed protein product [Lymnaea stagnalis]|uniref:Methylated-DNA--protein-cysteine methyltransferase n=1 Tax=Lymnaea stagnalis TaxID=6523 RepID=A0AAV2I4R7_LYMST